MRYKQIYQQVAKELNISPKVVHRVYLSSWRFIRQHVETFPDFNTISEQEFNQLQTNFNLPALGKMHLSYQRILNKKKQYEYAEKARLNKVANDQHQED